MNAPRRGVAIRRALRAASQCLFENSPAGLLKKVTRSLKIAYSARKCDLADRWDGFRPAVDDAEGHASGLQGLLTDEQHVSKAIHRMVSKGATILFFTKFSFDPCFLPLAHQLNFFFEIKIRSSHKFHHKAGIKIESRAVRLHDLQQSLNFVV